VYGASFAAPPSNFDYTSNEGGVYLRCYNGASCVRNKRGGLSRGPVTLWERIAACAGQLYGPSRHRTMSNASVHHVNTGDTVTVLFDGVAGTLAYLINGSPTGIVFNNLRGMTLYPAAGTYLSGR